MHGVDTYRFRYAGTATQSGSEKQLMASTELNSRSYSLVSVKHVFYLLLSAQDKMRTLQMHDQAQKSSRQTAALEQYTANAALGNFMSFMKSGMATPEQEARITAQFDRQLDLVANPQTFFLLLHSRKH